jgi:polysaccharide export outer membrane protein
VHAAGLTASQFAAALTASLAANYLRDPKVSIQIENYRPFYIMGEVNRPGEYPYENSLSALGAIALAGGYTYRANDTKVYIRRSGSAKEEVFPMSNTTIIYPGDVMRIVERFF